MVEFLSFYIVCPIFRVFPEKLYHPFYTYGMRMNWENTVNATLLLHFFLPSVLPNQSVYTLPLWEEDYFTGLDLGYSKYLHTWLNMNLTFVNKKGLMPCP